MKNYSTIKAGLLIGTIILLILFTVAPMAIGYNVRASDSKMLPETYKFNRYLYPENYHCYDLDEIPDFEKYNFRERLDNDNIQPEIKINPDKKPQPVDSPPMESPWPMHGHDVRHTGRSPYSTDDTWDEKWIFITSGPTSSPAIDKNGTIYVGSYDFYAVHPNGTLKWMYDTKGIIESCCPAIDKNGVIYVGTAHGSNYLYAFYPNGTLKWKYYTGHHIMSSPVIGEDETIYFGDWDGNINALNPDGTEKWVYLTGNVVTSSPAIGLDGTIYCGSHDGHVYAFYPNNGTVKWKFNTGSWVHGSPTIGDNGTVYIGSDNGYLYAFYPNNGTIKWKCDIGQIDASPALDEEGNLYVGVWQKKFYAIYPNGTVKWIFSPEAKIWGSSAAISEEGTIYFGTCDLESTGGIEIIALYSNGTLKWRKRLDTVFSSPAIGQNGTIYIGASNVNNGFLYTFGPLDPDAPSAPEIDGSISGRVGKKLEYIFKSKSPIGNDVYYWIEWGDGEKEEWIGPFSSGEEITKNHTWSEKGTYTIKARAKDTDNLWGPWSEYEIIIPRNRVYYNSLFLRLLDVFPMLERLLNLLIN